jgi:dihydroceramidase
LSFFSKIASCVGTSGPDAQVSLLRVFVAATFCVALALVVYQVANGPVDGANDSGEGVWGAKTATVNWCEADYVATPLIAEIGNSLSSLSIVFNGVFGLIMHHRTVELPYKLAFVAIVIVGFGSFAFHATLLRSMQIFDEVPMLWGNAVFIFILVSIEDHWDVRRRGEALAIAIATAVMTVLTVLYDQQNQDIFLLCYGSGVLYIGARSKRLHHTFESVRPLALLETSLSLYLGGFVLWLLDRNFCTSVRPLFFHALWHLSAGTGTFIAVIFWVFIRQEVRHGATPTLRGSTPMTVWVEPAIKA